VHEWNNTIFVDFFLYVKNIEHQTLESFLSLTSIGATITQRNISEARWFVYSIFLGELDQNIFNIQISINYIYIYSHATKRWWDKIVPVFNICICVFVGVFHKKIYLIGISFQELNV
jgi:hypothetical protein